MKSKIWILWTTLLCSIVLIVTIYFNHTDTNKLEFSDSKAEFRAEIIAHRGYHIDVPENSLAAVKAALDIGCDQIEIDVHQTKDGVLILIHDYTFSRTTEMDGMVKNKTWDEIVEFNKTAKFPIPSLDQVLEYIDGRAKCLIELKSGDSFYPNIEEHLIERIEYHDASEWVAVHSFSDEVVFNISRLSPSLEIHKLMIAYFTSINLMIDEGLHFISIDEYEMVDCFSVNYFFANKSIIELSHKMGKRINVWNLNNVEVGKSLNSLGVDGIITDSPQLFNHLSN